MPMPTLTSMDAAARTVVVTTYEELPHRRPGGYGATSSSTARARTHAAAGGGHNRRAMLLAYAQHLRRRGRQRSSSSGPPRVLEWGEWKQADGPGAGAGIDDKVVAGRRRSWCSRFRLWVRLCIRAFFRRVRTIRESASCKKAD